jgi:hypothetical protein
MCLHFENVNDEKSENQSQLEDVDGKSAQNQAKWMESRFNVKNIDGMWVFMMECGFI